MFHDTHSYTRPVLFQRTPCISDVRTAAIGVCAHTLQLYASLEFVGDHKSGRGTGHTTLLGYDPITDAGPGSPIGKQCHRT